MAAAPNVQAPAGGFQNGGWYGGQQFWNNTWSDPGVINSQSNQQGAGQAVSAEVNRQSSVAQGKDPNAIATYLANGASNGSPAPAGNDGSAANGGISGLLGGGGSPGTPNLQSIYDSAYTNNPDVKASMAKIADLQSQIATKQQAQADATKNVNDNPFYSEATRVGRVAKVNDAANQDMTVLNNQLTTEQANLTAKQAEAERQVNLATGQYNLNSQAYQTNLSNFNMLLNAGAFTNASPTDLATISAQTGISTSMLQSIQQTAQQKMVAPQIVTTTDGAGNVHITAVDKNTGKIINEEVLGGAGKGSGSKATTTTNNIIQSFGSSVSSAKGINSNGTYVGVFPQLVAQYAPYMSLQDIYKNYANTPQGKQWGTPKESSALVNQIYQQARKGTTPVN